MGTKRKTISMPTDLSPEATAEWTRIVEAIADLDREVKQADLSLLSLYIQTWQQHFTAYQHVKQWGPVVKWGNGTPGPSPTYKVCMETTKIMQKFLDQLGLTPAARDFDRKATDEDATTEITF